MSDEEEFGKYIKKVDMGPFVQDGDLNFVAGYSVPSAGGHVYVFGDPSDPLKQSKVVVDPNNDPFVSELAKGGNLSVQVKNDDVTLNVKKPDGTDDRIDLSPRRRNAASSDPDTVVKALAPSLQTLGDNQGVILDDMHTGFAQTFQNQQKMYTNLKEQEQMLAKVTAGVAGLTTLAYAIQQEINTLVIVFGVAFLVLAGALGYLIWKQNRIERELLYAVAYRRR